MKREVKYAKSGDIHIAYQVTGSGPIDLVVVPGFVSNLDADWDSSARARFIERLGSFSRLIRFDKRGTGLSDRVAIPSLEERMDDVRAVMDAVGSQRAALFGNSEGGPMSMLFAATYPKRTIALAMYGSYARRLWAPHHPYGKTPADWSGFVQRIEREWGGPVAIDVFSPSLLNDEAKMEAAARYFRQSGSPATALAIMQMNGEIDVSHALSSIRVPTLIMHRTGDRLTSVEQSRYLANHIQGAQFIELSGDDHVLWVGNTDAVADELELFLTGVRHAAEPDRVLATILFTDIVGSTERAVSLGDRKWRDLLAAHHEIVRQELSRHHGREIDTAGDGFFAAFDGPARGVRCAQAVINVARSRLQLDIRAGLHSGECQVIENKIAGLAVHVGARVAALANAGEVLVSQTVKDLVAGSGLTFEDRGSHSLKGVPGEWRLYSALAP